MYKDAQNPNKIPLRILFGIITLLVIGAYLYTEHKQSQFDQYMDRADRHANNGELREAVADYDRALEIDKNNADAYLNRGWAYYRMSNLQQARDDFTRAIELDVDDLAYAYSSRGYANYRLHDEDAAYADFSRAIDLNVGDTLGHVVSGGFTTTGKRIRKRKNITPSRLS